MTINTLLKTLAYHRPKTIFDCVGLTVMDPYRGKCTITKIIKSTRDSSKVIVYRKELVGGGEGTITVDTNKVIITKQYIQTFTKLESYEEYLKYHTREDALLGRLFFLQES